MAKLRLVVALVAMTGCVHQDTTVDARFPEPIEVNGPPGGDIEASWQSVGSPTSSGEIASTDPAAPGYAIGEVTDTEIDQTLDGYGEWVWEEDYGWVWRPYATEVGVDFTPYETCGSWVWTDDYGWVYGCDWEWGWLPFHYGQWGWFDDYWAWVPDYEWSPAWVDWRGGGGVVGWAPQVPVVRDHRQHTHTPRDHRGGDHDPSSAQGGVAVRDHRRATQRDSHWRFATVDDFGKRNIRAHLFKHAAEGLRLTSLVPRPPVRGNVRPVSAAAVMGDRHASQHRARPAITYTQSYAPLTPRAPTRSYAPTLRETPTAVEVPMDNPPSIYGPGDRFREPTKSPLQPSSTSPIQGTPPSSSPLRDTPLPVYPPPSNTNTWTPQSPVYQPPPSTNTWTPQPSTPSPVYQPPRNNNSWTPQPSAPVYQPPRNNNTWTPQPSTPVYQPPRNTSTNTWTPQPSTPVYTPSHSSGSSSWQPAPSHTDGGTRSHRR